MILKKPYAFLIKYFKLIHLICLFFIITITYNFQKIVNFFGDYNNTLNIQENAASTYISILFFIICIIVITFFILMFLLMKKKDKPSKFYLFGALYYIVIFLALIFAYNEINSLYTISMDIKIFRAIRDIYLMLYLPNFFFAIMSFIRGFGFDIKKFNFNKDLAELEIKSEDNEEFEFVLGADTYKIKRKIRRYIRELKYYFIENKTLVSLILGVFSIIIIIYAVLNHTVVNKTYSIGDTINNYEYSFIINSAIITSKDASGHIIKDDKRYVIINGTIKSNLNVSKILPPEYIYISFKNHRISNIKTTLASSFKDLGISYQNFKITPENNTYIFVFEVDKTKSLKTYDLNFFDTVTYEDDGTTTYNYKKAKIKPKDIDIELEETSKSYNEILPLGTDIYGTSALTINNAIISSKYEYQYEQCENETCQTLTDIEFPANSVSNTLLILDYNFKYDASEGITQNVGNSILKNIMQIKYKSNGEYLTEGIVPTTNSNISDKLIVEIPKTIITSEELYLMITTRQYIYSLKIK